MENLTILVCNHNTPDLIKNLIRSIRNTQTHQPHILVVDTGDQPTTQPDCGVTSAYLPKSSHGEGVNYSMNIVTTRYVLLVDSDVIFLKDVEEPYKIFREGGYTLMGEVVGDRGGKHIHPRVNPWFCFMDIQNLKENNISFYDYHRSKLENNTDKIYDVGCGMFEDVIQSGLTIANARMENKYFKHYEGMSWRVQKYDPNNGDTDIDISGTHDNRQLYDYGLMVRKQYEKDIKRL
jgi:glycosyltransferase involved in cell wall biosynthesis